jgi:hypothetical protein
MSWTMPTDPLLEKRMGTIRLASRGTPPSKSLGGR